MENPMKNWWLYLSFCFFFAANAFAATYDATGSWDYTDFNHSNTCGEPNPGTSQGTDVIIQKGDNFTLVGPSGTLTGSVSAATYTAMTTIFEDGGQTNLTFSVTASSSTQADGTVTWTWSDGVDSCSGGYQTSLTRQPQRPPTYDASGTWDYSEFNHSNTCGEPNAPPLSEVISISQNGNRVSVVDAAQQLYDGFIDASVYTFVRSYPEDGGTTSEIYTVPLDTGGTSGSGTGTWVWNDQVTVCDGAFSFTMTKQAPTAKHADTVVDFGVIGLWARMNDASWLKLNNSSPDQVVVGDMDGNGADDVIAYFSSFGGIFVKRNLGGWSQFSTLTPEAMAVGDLDGNGKDDVVIDFGGIGLWARMNDASWLKLNNSSPDQLVVGDMDGNGADDVIAYFSSFDGLFVKRNLGGWSQFSTLIPEAMAVGDLDGNGKDDVVVDFGGIGLWARMNDASWLKLHNSSPQLMATGDLDGNGADDVIATFAGLGLWQKLNLGGWSALSNSAPDQVVTGDVNASGKDDIIADFGSTLGGIFVKRDQGAWVKLHNNSPDTLAVGHLDSQ
jgi:hypothetical protein